MGLTAEEVVASRQKYGENVLTPPKKASVWSLFLEKFKDPLIIILLFAGVLSIGIACYEYYGLHHGATVFFEPVGIFVAIFLATAVSFYFEREADKQFSILNQVHDDEPVEVIRDGNVTSIPKREVVVGDIVVLPTGAEIPADGELLEAVSLSVDESSLTGEPVCRKSIHPEDFDPNATFATNRVLRGTKVMEGHGRMRVTAVGDATENGKVFEAAQIDNSVRTPLNEQLDRLGLLVTNVSYVFAALIIVGRLIVFFDWAPVVWTLALPTALFFYLVICRFKRWRWTFKAVASTSYFLLLLAMIYYFHLSLGGAEQWDDLVTYTLNTLMIAVTLIVVSVPEGLPMAVALSLAYSMRRMLKTNNLVRKMHACETMGATTVICTDKTGTLTQNKMQVYESRFFGMPSGCLRDDAVAEGMAVNSTASLDFSDPKSPQVLGNPTEGALLLWLDQQGVDYRQLREAASIDEELPFSTERKYMATVVRSPRLGGQRVLYVKGAPEIVLSLCAQTAGDVARGTIDGWLSRPGHAYAGLCLVATQGRRGGHRRGQGGGEGPYLPRHCGYQRPREGRCAGSSRGMYEGGHLDQNRHGRHARNGQGDRAPDRSLDSAGRRQGNHHRARVCSPLGRGTCSPCDGLENHRPGAPHGQKTARRGAAETRPGRGRDGRRNQ